MGPRSVERGNLLDSLALDFPLGGFNGAALCRARKPEDLVRGTGRLHASMGPRSVERGNDSAVGVLAFAWLASMGPRSVERGNDAAAPGPVHA